MYFKTLSATLLALGPMAAQAAFPVASVLFNSWDHCDVGHPTHGEPTLKADLTATPATCEKAPVNRDWSIDGYSFRAFLDTKDALLCQGVTVWNTDDCSGKPAYFLPFDGKPEVNGVCLPDFLDPGFVSVKLECHGFDAAGAAGAGPGGPDAGDSGDLGLF